MVALERSGQLLDRVCAAFFNSSSSHATDAIQAIETEVSPRLADHQDNIYLDANLYRRFQDLGTEGLDDESARLVDEYRKAFRRAGAQLEEAAQARLREINAELSGLSTKFSQDVLKDTNGSALLIEDPAELDGLPADDLATAAQAAQDAGHEGKYLLTLILPTNQPALEVLTNRDTRRRLFTSLGLPRVTAQRVQRAAHGRADGAAARRAGRPAGVRHTR